MESIMNTLIYIAGLLSILVLIGVLLAIIFTGIVAFIRAYKENNLW